MSFHPSNNILRAKSLRYRDKSECLYHGLCLKYIVLSIIDCDRTHLHPALVTSYYLLMHTHSSRRAESRALFLFLLSITRWQSQSQQEQEQEYHDMHVDRRADAPQNSGP